MKRYVMSFICIIAVFMLSGCRQVPKEVIDNKARSNKEYTNNSKIKEVSEYDTIEHIFKTIGEVTSSRYSNLTFAKGIQINRPKELAKIQFKVVENYDETHKEIIKDFVGKKYSHKFCTRTPDKIDPPGYDYDDKDQQIHFGLGDNGFFFYYNNDQSQKDYFNSRHGIHTIFLREKYKNVSYHLKDGDMSINEALQNVNSYLRNKVNKYLMDIELIPYAVIVVKNKSGNFTYDFKCMLSYHNVYFNSVCNFKEPASYASAFRATILVDSKKQSYLMQINNIFLNQNTIKKYDKIISLKSAVSKVEKLLSAYSKYTIHYVNLEYKLISKDKTQDVVVGRAGEQYETKPCWTFFLDPSYEKEQVAMVDCITGETEFVNNSNN